MGTKHAHVKWREGLIVILYYRGVPCLGDLQCDSHYPSRAHIEIDFRLLDTISRVAIYGSSSETVYFVTRELERIMAIDDDAT